MSTFRIKQGDLAPSLAVQLRDESGDTDTSAATGYFILSSSKSGAGQLFRSACTINNSTGSVQYDWASGDTDYTPGEYYGEFEITVAGKPRTYPVNGYIKVQIIADLD